MTEHDLTESQLVGSRIRDARINRRMSQADLAEMCIRDRIITYPQANDNAYPPITAELCHGPEKNSRFR